jgi:sulfotransferase
VPEKIFFQSSLPRVGSTVFQNLMNQDPRFYATSTSGMLELIYAARHNYTESPEFKAQDADLMKKAFFGFCNKGMHGFYEAMTDKPYILDKSRGHMASFDLISGFYPNPKMICLVRSLPDVVASMEKMFRKNQHRSNPIVNNMTMQGITTPRRVDMWFNSPPIGIAVERLSEAIRQGHDKKMLFIKYESLCLYPELEMKRVYEFLEIEPFQHDFSHIEQTTKEDDVVYGYEGLHTIRPSLEMFPSDAKDILGKDVVDWINNKYKWYNDYFGYSY